MHEVNLIPDTTRSDTIVVSRQCDSCETGNDKWQPNHDPYNNRTITLDYFSQLKTQQTNLTGAYYREMGCFDNIDACGAGMHLFGVQKAEPDLSLNADGFLGLGIDMKGCKYNTLNQMKEKGMINDKVFGVYTSMKKVNATEMDDDYVHSSQIRFGGINEELVEADKE